MQTCIAAAPQIRGVPLEPIHERCNGCAKVIAFDGFDGLFCSIYRKPSVFWDRGGCAMATHVDFSVNKEQGKKRAGQQKSKKSK